MKLTDRKILASAAVVSAVLDDEAVLLNVETGMYFGLDAVGTRIWGLLERGATEDEIVQALFEEFEVELNHLRLDVVQFLDLLTEKGLVRLEDA